MREVNNFFEVSGEQGEFIIADNNIQLKNTYLTGQYIAITGSILNNGVYKVAHIDDTSMYSVDGELTDEEFYGVIWGLKIPRDFLTLVAEIEAFNAVEEVFDENSKSVLQTPVANIVSERFGNQSYTKATDKDGSIITWQTAFKHRLRRFYKMFSEVQI